MAQPARPLHRNLSMGTTIKEQLRKYPDALQHVSYAITGLSLLHADIALLRLFAVASNAVALADVLVVSGVSTAMCRWHARWNSLYLTMNGVWLAIIVGERFAWLNEEEEELYQASFAHCFSRPEFKTLLRHGDHAVATEPKVLIQEGTPSHVYLILDSDKAHVMAKGHRINFNDEDTAPRASPPSKRSGLAPAFEMRPNRPVIVGEASYLSDRDASARVVAERGCCYYEWTRESLRAMEESEEHAELHKRVEVWLGLALSEKLRKTTATFVASVDEVEQTRAAIREMRYEAHVRHHVFEKDHHVESDVTPPASLKALHETLAEHRRHAAIDSEVHSTVMRRLGLPADVEAAETSASDMPIQHVRRALAAKPMQTFTPMDAAAAKREAARRIFEAIDGNGDGEISKAELEEHFRQRMEKDQMMLDHIFTELDDDHSGTVSLEEFSRSIDTFCRGTHISLPIQVPRG